MAALKLIQRQIHQPVRLMGSVPQAFPRGAVAVTVIKPAGGQSLEFLLAKRKNPPGAGTWSIPGGKLELGEPTVAGGARELFEETGLRAGIHVAMSDRSFTTSDAIYRDPNGNVLFHYLIAQLWAGVIHPNAVERAQASDDVSELGWFTLSEVESGELTLGGNVGQVLQQLTAQVKVDESTGRVVPL